MSDSTDSNAFRLPEVTLTAAGSGREVFLGPGSTPLVLVFHGQDTADQAVAVHKAVRRKYPHGNQVVIASIIDLRSFPSMFHGMVTPVLEKAYLNAASKLPPGADPAEQVVILPDWDGAVHEAVGIQDSTRQAAVIVTDAARTILCRDQGDDPANAAVGALDKLLAT